MNTNLKQFYDNLEMLQTRYEKNDSGLEPPRRERSVIEAELSELRREEGRNESELIRMRGNLRVIGGNIGNYSIIPSVYFWLRADDEEKKRYMDDKDVAKYIEFAQEHSRLRRIYDKKLKEQRNCRRKIYEVMDELYEIDELPVADAVQALDEIDELPVADAVQALDKGISKLRRRKSPKRKRSAKKATMSRRRKSPKRKRSAKKATMSRRRNSPKRKRSAKKATMSRKRKSPKRKRSAKKATMSRKRKSPKRKRSAKKATMTRKRKSPKRKRM